MRKLRSISKLLLILCMMLSLYSAAHAEEARVDILEDLSHCSFTFTSGVGAWYTTLEIAPDGSFTGTFHDSDLGDTGDAYPNGTVYGCLFHGRFELGQQLSEISYQLLMPELALDEGQLPEAYEYGVRYVTAEPYGLVGAEDLVLYLPGAPVQELPEEFMSWVGYSISDVLPFYGIYNRTEGYGFFSEEKYDWGIIGGADCPTTILLADSFEQFTDGWQMPDDLSVNNIAADVFSAASETIHQDISLEPIFLLATQEGDCYVMYCFLCRSGMNNGSDGVGYCLAYIRQGFNGDCCFERVMPLIL